MRTDSVELCVLGSDYPTPDGTRIREYVHVDDRRGRTFERSIASGRTPGAAPVRGGVGRRSGRTSADATTARVPTLNASNRPRPRGLGVRILPDVTLPDDSALETSLNDEPPGYLSGHFRSLKSELNYDRAIYARKALRTFGSSLPQDRNATILEIGPGECELAEFLRNEAGYVHMSIADMSPEVIDVATELGIPATLVEDTSAFLRRHAECHDAVILLHVLEHIQKNDVIGFLRDIRTSLRPGGVLVLEVPNMGDPLNGLFFRYSDFTHEVGFTEQSLEYVLTQAGFREVTFLDQVGADGPTTRALQRLARAVLHAMLYTINLPNGRQMRRRIGPVLSVRTVV